MSGKRIVLAASDTEANEYKQSVWRQMLYAAMPARFARFSMSSSTLENELTEDGQAKYVPHGLRVIESLLLREFSPDDIAVCFADQLERFVGPDTRVIGIHAHNPLGITFATDIYASFYGSCDEPWNASAFRRLITHPVLKQHKPGFKLIVGGPGSWQIEVKGLQDAWGIDCIVKGEAEDEAVTLFRAAVEGQPLPRTVVCSRSSRTLPPVTRRRSTLGVVEITRGCGRGCSFCGPASRPIRSFPIKHVLDNVRANVRGGASAITLATEDLFLYQHGPRLTPNGTGLQSLLEAVGNEPGVEYVSLTHGSMAPIVQDPSLIERLSPIAVGKSHRRHAASTDPENRYATLFAGIETGSARLMRQYMKGKSHPFPPERWPDIVLRGMETLNRHNWFPFCTWIIGLPGETREDTKRSLDLLHALKDSKWTAVPTLFVALEDSRLSDHRNANLPQLTDLQWELFFTCWRFNLDFYCGRPGRLKYAVGVPLYYYLYARKHFGPETKFPFWRLAHFPEWLLSKRLYLDLRKGVCSPSALQPEASSPADLHASDEQGRSRANTDGCAVERHGRSGTDVDANGPIWTFSDY